VKIDDYDVETLLLAAIKSEVDSAKTYSQLAKKVKNAMLKDRLEFLAAEEEKHRRLFEQIYREKFPDKELELPSRTRVPLPDIDITHELMPLSDVFRMAMKAEQAAYDFYNALAGRFDKAEISNVIRYAASMEKSHYDILDVERVSLAHFEEAADYNPFVHLGP